MSIMVICKDCGKEFEVKSSRGKYCSRACYLRSAKKENLQRKKHCKVCGKEIDPSHRRYICSARCREILKQNTEPKMLFECPYETCKIKPISYGDGYWFSVDPVLGF